MKVFITGFLLFIFCFNLPAQSKQDLTEQTQSENPNLAQAAYLELAKSNVKDSSVAIRYLKEVLKDESELEDSTFIKLMNGKIAVFSQLFAHQAAKEVAYLGLKRYRQTNDSILLADCYKQLSASCYKIGQLDSTSYYLDLAAKLFKKLGDLENYSMMVLRMGGVEYSQGNYAKALKTGLEATEILKESNQEKQLAIAYWQMGNIHYFLNNLDEAYTYYGLSADYNLMISDSLSWAFALSNKGLVMIAQDSFAAGLEIQKSTLPWVKKTGRLISVGSSYQYIGLAHLGLENLDSATHYIKKSDSIYAITNYEEGHTYNLINQARVSFKRGNLTTTLEYAEEIDSLINGDSKAELRKEYYEHLNKWQAKNGQFTEAYNTLSRYLNLRDSLDQELLSIENLAKSGKSQLAKTEYELKLAKQRELLSRQENKSYYTMIIVLSIVVVITLFFTGILSSRSRRVRLLNRELQEKQQLLESELNTNQALLKEVHHRVKNNLQVISSMLSIQSSGMDDKDTRKILQECKSRILSMSLIHESLYKKEGKKTSLFSTYIKELIPQLLETYHLDENKINLEMSIEDIELSLDDSVPCGLIINEVVTNTLKHAFPGDREGTISIEMSQDSGHNYLKLADDGVGIPKDLNAEEQGSFGFLLIYTLAEQLEASIELDTSKGTTFSISWETKKDKLLS